MTRALALASPLAHHRKNLRALTRTHRGPERIVQAGSGVPLFFCLCGRLTERERGRCAWCETHGARRKA